MLSSKIPFRYAVKTYRKEQFWMPPVFIVFFCILSAFFLQEQRAYTMAAAFLGYVLPLIAGVLASSPILSDPALELHFASPISAKKLLIARYGVLLVVITLSGFVFQGCMALMGVDLNTLGDFWKRQFVWFVPSLTMLTVGCFTALLFRQATGGSVFAGGLWIFQLTMKGFLLSKPLSRYLVLFMGASLPNAGSELVKNQICLTLTSLVMLYLSVRLLKKQETLI